MTSVNAELYHREFDRKQERHEWDENDICTRCGFDRGEWECRQVPFAREVMPPCEGHP